MSTGVADLSKQFINDSNETGSKWAQNSDR